MRRFGPFTAAVDRLVRLVARVPATIHAKLLAAFLVIVTLLFAVGAVGLYGLTDAHDRAEDHVQLQRKIAAYRQVQHDATAQLYSVSSALLAMDERTLDATLRQLNQFGYDLDRLKFVAQGEQAVFERVRDEFDAFVKEVTWVVDLIRKGRAAEGRAMQLSRVVPVADRLERLTNELVNKAEAEMVESVEASRAAYVTSLWASIILAAGSIAAALGLGYVISSAIVRPVGEMESSLEKISSGDFSPRLEIPNRDEFGALAAHLNAMAQELATLYRQLETASRHKSEFLANMSHELRTPLNAVIGFSEALQERMFGELNEKQADYVNDIHVSGKHLLSLINDILDLSKIEAGRMELDAAEFDLPAMLDNAMTLVRERAARHAIALSLEVDPGLGTYHGDERKLKQVTLNLLSNAVKFTPDAGSVRAGAKLNGATIEVFVADSGIGIAPEDQALVFEEFQQVGRDRARKAEGTGLGLALSKKFVELHGGALRLESEPGRGSTFTFTLPVRPQ